MVHLGWILAQHGGENFCLPIPHPQGSFPLQVLEDRKGVPGTFSGGGERGPYVPPHETIKTGRKGQGTYSGFTSSNLSISWPHRGLLSPESLKLAWVLGCPCPMPICIMGWAPECEGCFWGAADMKVLL